METEQKVMALIRFYSQRYALVTDDWLQALIEMECTDVKTPPPGPTDSWWARYRHGPRSCEHCGKRTQYGMGAMRHHTNKHPACDAEHNYSVNP